MITAACFLIFIAFYLFYCTSRKVKFASPGLLQSNVERNRTAAKVVTAVLFIAALGLFVTLAGAGAGTLYFFIALMVLGSLVVLLAPLGIFSLKQLVPLFIICFALDYFIHY